MHVPHRCKQISGLAWTLQKRLSGLQGPRCIVGVAVRRRITGTSNPASIILQTGSLEQLLFVVSVLPLSACCWVLTYINTHTHTEETFKWRLSVLLRFESTVWDKVNLSDPSNSGKTMARSNRAQFRKSILLWTLPNSEVFQHLP